MNKIKIKIGIYALSMLSMATLIVSPVMGLIVKAFPYESLNKVQMIIAVANLTGLIAAFIVGRLSLSISKRSLALFGALGTCIFGLIPYFAHPNITVLIILSGLVGVTVGFITNVIPGLITDYFADTTERENVLGKEVAFVSIGTMLMMAISGNLGLINWYSSYLTYIFAGLVFLIALVCLPKEARQKVDTKHNKKQSPSVKDVFTKNVFITALLGFSFMIVNNVFNNNIALVIDQAKMGNSSLSGTITTIAQLGGLIAGLLVGYLVKIFKHEMLGIAFMVEGIALLIIAFSHNVILVGIGAFLAGAGQSFFFAQAPFLITISVAGILVPMGMAVLSTANSIGGFLSPTLANFLNNAFFGKSAQTVMLVGAIISLIVGLIVLLTKFQEKCMSKIRN